MKADCPPPAAWRKLIAGTLPAERLAELERHLDQCADCRQWLDECHAAADSDLALTLVAGGDSPGPDAAPVEQVMRDLIDERTQRDPAGGAADILEFLDPSSQSGSLGRVGTYEVISVVARGGMGVVVKARDPDLDRFVAIKLMAPELAAGQAFRDRFLREARAVAALHHENIIAIHAVSSIRGIPYIAMPFVAGTDLQRLVDSHGPLGTDRLAALGIQIARGLGAAHERGLIHRDIKPANVLVAETGDRLWLTDFGLARLVEDAGLTRPGMILGTPGYMAPEQIRGEAVDHRSDLYALGGVLFFMCTGRSPFAGGTVMSTLQQALHDPAPRACDLSPGLPAELGALIDRLLAKDPAQRCQSAREVERALGGTVSLAGSAPAGAQPVAAGVAAESIPVERRTPERARPRTRVRVGWMVAGAALAAFVLGLFLEFTGRTTWVNAAVASWSGRPFSIRGRWGGYADLGEALDRARAGDCIEVRRGGEITVPPIRLGKKPVWIRAVDGWAPTLLGREIDQPVMSTETLLVLEGIALQQTEAAQELTPVLLSQGSALRVAGCSFARPWIDPKSAEGRSPCVGVAHNARVEIVNSEFYNNHGSAIAIHRAAPAWSGGFELAVENSVLVSERALGMDGTVPGALLVRFVRTVCMAARGIVVVPPLAFDKLRVEATGNLFDVRQALVQAPGALRAELVGRVAWVGVSNVYRAPQAYVSFALRERGIRDVVAPSSLSAWQSFPSVSDQDAIELPAAPNRRALLARQTVRTLPRKEELGLDESLREGRPGTGPILDQVGPGPSLERWRQTPQYRAWAAESRRLLRAAAQR